MTYNCQEEHHTESRSLGALGKQGPAYCFIRISPGTITEINFEMFANGSALVFWISPNKPNKSFFNGRDFSEIISFSKTGSDRAMEFDAFSDA